MRSPLAWYRALVRDCVRKELSPDLKWLAGAIEGVEKKTAERLDRVERRMDDLNASLAEGAALTMARYEAIGRRTDAMLAAVDAASARIDATLGRSSEATLEMLRGVEERVVAHHEEAVQGGIARLGTGPGTKMATQITAWMGSPAWSAALYAVEKSARDSSLPDNDLRRSQALEWARRWLREYGHAVPSDRTLNLLIELVVLERKGIEAMP